MSAPAGHFSALHTALQCVFSSLPFVMFNCVTGLVVRKRLQSFEVGHCILQKWGGRAMLQTTDPLKMSLSSNFSYFICSCI